MIEQNDQAGLQAALADAAAASGLDDARLFTQQGMFTRRILDAMGLEALDATICKCARKVMTHAASNWKAGARRFSKRFPNSLSARLPCGQKRWPIVA